MEKLCDPVVKNVVNENKRKFKFIILFLNYINV